MALKEFEVEKSKNFKKGDKVLLLEDIETIPNILNKEVDENYRNCLDITEFKDTQPIEVGTVLRRRPCIFNPMDMSYENFYDTLKKREQLKYGWEYKVHFPKTKKKVYIHESNLQGLEPR